MSGWPIVAASRLASMCVLRIEDGNHGESRPRSDEFVETGVVSYIRAADMSAGTIDFNAASKINEAAMQRITKGKGMPNDVLLSHKGTVGKVAIAPWGAPAFVCSPQTTFWRSLCPEMLDPRFLAYYLRSPEFVRQLDSRKGETDMAAYVSLTEQRKLQVRMPPVHVQRCIAYRLGGLDDKIESNRRLQKTALELAGALVSTATHGAPTVVYNAVMSVVMGSAFKGDEFSTPGMGRPLLRIRDLKTFSSQTWTTESRVDETVIQPGDIVVGMDAEFRATLWQGAPSLLNQRVCAFRPCDGVSRAFLLSALSPQLAFFENAKSGTTVIHLNKADIDRFVIPSLTAQQHAHLAEQTEPLMDLVVNMSAQSSRLAALRDVLLPELLSGRIRVPEASQGVESALA